MKTFTTLMLLAWATGAVVAFVSHNWILGTSLASAMVTTMVCSDDEEKMDEV